MDDTTKRTDKEIFFVAGSGVSSTTEAKRYCCVGVCCKTAPRRDRNIVEDVMPFLALLKTLGSIYVSNKFNF